MKKITVFGCAILLLFSGCLMGDRVPASRTVSLYFLVPANQRSLSITDEQVQEALKLVDHALVSRGFARDPSEVSLSESGFVASYAKYNGTGPRLLGGPSVYLKGDRLEVVVVAGGNRNSGLTRASKQLCNLLKNELSAHYGSKRVKIER